MPLLLRVERPEGRPRRVPVQLKLEEDLRVGGGGGALGAATHLLLLQRVPPLPTVLHLEQRQGQLAKELESEEVSVQG